MEVKFDPVLQEKLERSAAEQGRRSEALVVEAVERMLGYEEWFLGEVKKRHCRRRQREAARPRRSPQAD